MASSRGRRIGAYLAIAVACLLLFLIPSSYVVARGGPGWLAAVIGALAFPVVPGVWHAIGERRRKRRLAAIAAALKTKAPVKTAAGLTGRDRLALRMIAVALVALAPLVVFDRGHVWAGLRHHALWFVPADAEFDGGYADGYLDRVPADADAVAVMRDHPMRLIDRSFTQHGAAVFAMRGDDTMMVLPRTGAVRELVEKVHDFLGQARWGSRVPALTPVVHGDVVVLAAGERGWGTVGTGPGAALEAQLARTPSRAVVAIAIAPSAAAGRDGITAGSAWIAPTSTGIELGARLELVDAAAAAKLVAEGQTGLRSLASAAADPHSGEPACTDAMGVVGGAVQIEQAGTVVTVHGRIPLDAAHMFLRCVTRGLVK